eukprot:363999-Chlamydomonas_euryale.AAC.4
MAWPAAAVAAAATAVAARGVGGFSAALRGPLAPAGWLGTARQADVAMAAAAGAALPPPLSRASSSSGISSSCSGSSRSSSSLNMRSISKDTSNSGGGSTRSVSNGLRTDSAWPAWAPGRPRGRRMDPRSLPPSTAAVDAADAAAGRQRRRLGSSAEATAEPAATSAAASAGPSSERLLMREFIQQSLYHPVSTTEMGGRATCGLCISRATTHSSEGAEGQGRKDSREKGTGGGREGG